MTTVTNQNAKTKQMKSFLLVVFSTIVFMPWMGHSRTIEADTTKTVYQSDELVITQLTEHVYVHTTFFDSETFGRVPCNGMVVAHQNEAIIFDTPTDDSSSAELIQWISQNLQANIKAVIPTHFHEDCVGGLKEFEKHQIPSYANQKTITLAKKRKFNVPTHGFKDSLTLTLGDQRVYAMFLGEGHTKDNIIGYFPGDQIMFGGCLIKALQASEGNLEDANVKEWSETVEKVKNKYPAVKTVIPGHGEVGDKALLDYTIQLFDQY